MILHKDQFARHAENYTVWEKKNKTSIFFGSDEKHNPGE